MATALNATAAVPLRIELDRLAGESQAHFNLEDQAMATALNAATAAPPTACTEPRPAAVSSVDLVANRTRR
ncbi:hypothetical protein CU254_21680 [Amycolatopsis sp. AA4]|uniref:hypothetical protein n=1 Tax=Actinomycetes TaxID=1760 RepID=UPI0001B5706A|nr:MULTISPECIES: hypothetical protein [Actinomycetes]ATY12777.1 hypothetical protein CU254_21680 [Amycolatopsis sp. AA4]